MTAPTQYYVDPSIAADSGAGTVGDPYGDLQYALDTITRDSSNGDQINIKSGTDEVLAAGGLDKSGYGFPQMGAPLIFRGYTSAANDGGIGGIDNNSNPFFAVTDSFMIFADLHIHNAGSNTALNLGQRCLVYNCEINNTSGTGILGSSYTNVIGCHIHDVGDSGIQGGLSSQFWFNYVQNDGTNDVNWAIISTAFGMTACFNVINIDGASDGIVLREHSTVIGNTIYSNGGTGSGIRGQVGTWGTHVLLNNNIEGFSGVGGIGVEAVGYPFIAGYNAFFNNTTDESISNNIHLDLANDQALGATSLTNAGGEDFSVNTSLQALGVPSSFLNSSTNQYIDIGAAQRQEAESIVAIRSFNSNLRR